MQSTEDRNKANVRADAGDARLSLSLKLVYGLGEIAVTTKGLMFGMFTLYLYSTVMGLPGALVGVIAGVGLVWDAVIDPYIGHVSDRSTSRFGRRHTPMAWGAFLVGFSFWAYMSPPQGLSTSALFLWCLVSSVLVRTAISVFGIPYLALGAELSEDYQERTSVTGIRGCLAMLGTMLAAVASFVVFFPETTPGVDPKLNYDGYPAMGLTFGLCMSACALAATFGTLSRRHPPGHTKAAVAMGRIRAREWFAGVAQSRSLIVLVLSCTLYFMAVVLNRSVFLHYLTYQAGITDSRALGGFEFVLFVSGILGVFFWMRMSRRLEKATMYSISAFTSAAVLVVVFFTIGEGRLFGTGNWIVIAGGLALAGFFGSVVRFVPPSMIADGVDEDELENGRRREGALFGIFSFSQQLATGLAVFVGAILLDWFAGLVPGQAEQTAQTAERIAVLFALVPAFLLVVAGILSLQYKLTHQRVEQIQKALHERRQLDEQPAGEL